MSALLLEYFIHSEEWSAINNSLFERILYHLTNHAVKLFRTIPLISEYFIPVTKYEKSLTEIFSFNDNGDSSFSFKETPLFGPSASPLKKMYSQSHTDFMRSLKREKNVINILLISYFSN